jgi:hypothetical protein
MCCSECFCWRESKEIDKKDTRFLKHAPLSRSVVINWELQQVACRFPLVLNIELLMLNFAVVIQMTIL